MKKTALCLICGAALAGAVSVASADEPLPLSAEQMDQVTAGLGLVDLTERLERFAQLQSGLALTLFAGLINPTDETVEGPFGSIQQKITEIRERIFNQDITLGGVGIPDPD